MTSSGRQPVPPPGLSWAQAVRLNLKRIYGSLGQLSPLHLWLLARGIPILLFSLLVYLFGACAVGWWSSYDLLLGIKSPSEFGFPVIPTVVSLFGWILVPALIGGLAGFLVERGITSHRSKSFDET